MPEISLALRFHDPVALIELMKVAYELSLKTGMSNIDVEGSEDTVRHGFVTKLFQSAAKGRGFKIAMLNQRRYSMREGSTIGPVLHCVSRGDMRLRALAESVCCAATLVRSRLVCSPVFSQTGLELQAAERGLVKTRAALLGMWRKQPALR